MAMVMRTHTRFRMHSKKRRSAMLSDVELSEGSTQGLGSNGKVWTYCCSKSSNDDTYPSRDDLVKKTTPTSSDRFFLERMLKTNCEESGSSSVCNDSIDGDSWEDEDEEDLMTMLTTCTKKMDGHRIKKISEDPETTETLPRRAHSSDTRIKSHVPAASSAEDSPTFVSHQLIKDPTNEQHHEEKDNGNAESSFDQRKDGDDGLRNLLLGISLSVPAGDDKDGKVSDAVIEMNRDGAKIEMKFQLKPSGKSPPVRGIFQCEAFSPSNSSIESKSRPTSPKDAPLEITGSSQDEHRQLNEKISSGAPLETVPSNSRTKSANDQHRPLEISRLDKNRLETVPSASTRPANDHQEQQQEITDDVRRPQDPQDKTPEELEEAVHAISLLSFGSDYAGSSADLKGDKSSKKRSCCCIS